MVSKYSKNKKLWTVARLHFRKQLAYGLRTNWEPMILEVTYFIEWEYSTVDGRSKRKCYWTRASCDCGRLQIGDVTRKVKCMSTDYTNPNTNPKTLTTLALTLTDPHGAFESFCAPAYWLCTELFLHRRRCSSRLVLYSKIIAENSVSIRVSALLGVRYTPVTCRAIFKSKTSKRC